MNHIKISDAYSTMADGISNNYCFFLLSHFLFTTVDYIDGNTAVENTITSMRV